MAKQVEHATGVDAVDVETNDDAAGTPRDDASAALPPGLGQLLGFSDDGFPVIALSNAGEGAMEVPTTVALGRDDIGATVLVTFVDGRADQPIVTGRILPPQAPAESNAGLRAEGALTIDADGETVTIEAERELVLRCGKASVRLRRDGRVEVRGVDVVSRAARTNWIKGGSVALN